MYLFFVTLILAPLSYIWKGFVIATLWGWFVVEKFNLPALSIPVAIGLSLIATQLISPRVKEEDNEQCKIFTWTACFLWPALGLLYGWIAHLFM